MSCNTCLNSEKQPEKCVFDEDGKSLTDKINEIKSDIDKLKSIEKPIDKKWISKNGTLADYVQELINKVGMLEKTINNNILETKIFLPTISNTPISINEALITLSEKVQSNTDNIKKENATKMYVPQTNTIYVS